jgi:hypothetical protein
MTIKTSNSTAQMVATLKQKFASLKARFAPGKPSRPADGDNSPLPEESKCTIVPEEIILQPLTRYRDLLLYEPSPDEAQQIKAIGDQLREARIRQNLRRREAAALLQLDIELLTMVENGYGNLEMAQRVLRQAEALLKGR